MSPWVSALEDTKYTHPEASLAIVKPESWNQHVEAAEAKVRQLESGKSKLVNEIQTIDGETITVSAKRDPETDGFYRPTEFQLWSLGADGKNGEYDEGDDICHWK